jgi:hypothetical protein
LLKVYGLKIGAIHRNRFAARVLELLEMAALTELSAAIEPLLRVREGMRTERKALDRTLAAAARHSDVGRRLMTIPGVGPGPPSHTSPRSCEATSCIRAASVVRIDCAAGDLTCTGR